MTATQTQIRRDTSANLNAATPATGELGYDTTNKRLVVGDGSTLGGIRHASFKDIQNNTFIYGTVGGTADVITLTNSPVCAAYATGQTFRFKAGSNNTGATTMNVDGLGAKNILKMVSNVLTALEADDLTSGGIYDIHYDGTQFQIKALNESASSEGGLVLLSIQTASASSELDFESVITSDYSSYVFVLEDIRPATNATDLYFRTSSNNGVSYDSTGTHYSWFQVGFDGSLLTDNADTSDSQIYLTNTDSGLSNVAQSALSGVVELLNPASASANKRVTFHTTYNTAAEVNGSGSRLSTTAVNAVRFLMSSGNITSGKIRCYGRKAAI